MKPDRLMSGGSLSWSGESEPVSARDSIWVIAGVFLLVMALAGLVWLLSVSQSTGEPPEYTCDPDNAPYVLEECQ